MLLQPIADTGHRPFISVGAWMWAMEDQDLLDKHHGYPATLLVTDFSPKLNQKRLNITPLDIGADWMGKDGFQGPLVLSFHVKDGTTIRYHLQGKALRELPTLHGAKKRASAARGFLRVGWMLVLGGDATGMARRYLLGRECPRTPEQYS